MKYNTRKTISAAPTTMPRTISAVWWVLLPMLATMAAAEQAKGTSFYCLLCRLKPFCLETFWLATSRDPTRQPRLSEIQRSGLNCAASKIGQRW